IYIRKCYTEWFKDFLAAAKKGLISFAVSGTPGIGKSWLAIYLLYCIPRSMDLKERVIIYHYGNDFYHFALNGEVRVITKDSARIFADGKPAIYIVDGKESIALQVAAPCITIYIS